MTVAPQTAPLDYAPGAPFHRKRRFRLIVLLCLIVAMVFAGLRWGRTTWSRLSMLYHQRRCLRYVAPPDQVVFDSDPARVALRAGDPNYVISGGCAFRKPSSDWLAIRQTPATWLAFKPTTTVGGPGPAAIIFLHELHVGRISRLVEVERVGGATMSPYFIISYDVDTHSITPASFKQPRLSEQYFGYAISVLDGGTHRDIRIYAGQIDPADGSHFTIRYEYHGETHTADGYLRADGRIDLQRN